MIIKFLPNDKGVTIVDDEDADLLEHIWYGGSRYARRTTRDGGVWYTYLLHRVIAERMFGPIGVGMTVDHISGDGRDNRRSNLRLATHAQNLWNSKKSANRTSRFKGVSRFRNGQWKARIVRCGVEHYLGLFDTEAAAAEAVDRLSSELSGGFDRGNLGRVRAS